MAVRLTEQLRDKLRLRDAVPGRDAKRAHEPEIHRLEWLLQPYVEAEFAQWPSVHPELTTHPRDTLIGLAIRHLGSEARWREIVELNPGIDPTKLLTPGARLRLPEDAVGI